MAGSIYVLSRTLGASCTASLLLALAQAASAETSAAPPATMLPPGTFGIAIAFMLIVAVMKLTAFVLGYLIVKLGHDTLIKGVTGQIDFGFKSGAVSGKLKSGSPGAFFVLAGGAIIAWGLFVKKPMEIVVPVAAMQTPAGQSAPEKPAPRLDVPQ